MEGAYLFALLTVRINTHHEKYRAFTFKGRARRLSKGSGRIWHW